MRIRVVSAYVCSSGLADLQPLLFAIRQIARQRVAAIGEADLLQYLLGARTRFRLALAGKTCPPVPVARRGDGKVVDHRQGDEHAGRLELAAGTAPANGIYAFRGR